MDTHEAGATESLDALRKDIRQICHDMSNPLGIMRMAVYVVQTTKADPAKHAHYFAMMSESLDKMDTHLKRLRALAVGEAETGSR